MFKNLSIPLCVAIIVVTGFHLGRKLYIAKDYPLPPGLYCLEGAKNQRLIGHNKTTHRTPTWADIRPYLSRTPVRPNRGTAPQLSPGVPQHPLSQ